MRHQRRNTTTPQPSLETPALFRKTVKLAYRLVGEIAPCKRRSVQQSPGPDCAFGISMSPSKDKTESILGPLAIAVVEFVAMKFLQNPNASTDFNNSATRA